MASSDSSPEEDEEDDEDERLEESGSALPAASPTNAMNVRKAAIRVIERDIIT